jgi:divalent metal cation (Fe/Co/Zn/Cd) transporter
VIKARAAMVMNHRGDGPSSTAAVYAALVWDILVALSKALAAVWTGSASMTSEAIHSFVDTTNEILLLHGIHRSQQEADADHPFGYGREIFFGASWCRS